ncbi:hypothetical protein FIBSPDRAFT_900554 [Athelia psychrophila]|uniref:Uncharacterized protein n=1 Tax=Athelia psychrophila TaxID=1759441 RepID=A0A165YBI6_9AGAM|nr:hypothetical protein FIBSPDRAFT_900554 [Fibularhizoctonia sp. CBS 109695]
MFALYIPWFASIWLMTNNTVIIHAIAVPLSQVIFNIFVKRLMDLNKEGSAAAHSHRGLIKRFIDPIFLSSFNLKTTPVVFRAMSVKTDSGGGGGWTFGGQGVEEWSR